MKTTPNWALTSNSRLCCHCLCIFLLLPAGSERTGKRSCYFLCSRTSFTFACSSVLLFELYSRNSGRKKLRDSLLCWSCNILIIHSLEYSFLHPVLMFRSKVRVEKGSSLRPSSPTVSVSLSKAEVTFDILTHSLYLPTFKLHQSLVAFNQ